MRVLMVTHPLPKPHCPGRLAPIARQIASLRQIGLQVDVLELRGMRKLKYLRALPAQWTHSASVDLVHAHYGTCGWLARSQLRRPLIVSFMGDDLLGTPDAEGRLRPLSKWGVRINCWLAHNVDAVIVKSAAMAKVIAPVKSHIVPNGVDLRLFQPIDGHQARKILGWTDRKRYVLFPGNPDTPGKGFRLAQMVLKQACKAFRAPLEMIPLWGIASDQVPLYMNACHAMLMTSFSEGSPNVVKEAMACNLPVISVPVGDVYEILADVKGCKICSYQSETLADALAGILKSERRTDGYEALVRKKLDLESVAYQIHSIYQDVLKKKY